MIFPNARNSLRRWSEHKNKIPIPVAATLYNLMADQDVQLTSKWFTEHASSLLRPVRLEIVIVPLDENQEEKLVFSAQQSGMKSVHPSWEHLDERINLPENWWNQEDKSYRSMKLRFVVDSDLSCEDEGGSTNSNSKVLLLEIPAHPTLLQPLAEVPSSLPPNSCLVYYSDGSNRVTMSLFQILLNEKITELPPPSSEIDDFSRFEDDVFSTLDQVTPQKAARVRISSASALLLEKEEQHSPSSEIDRFSGDISKIGSSTNIINEENDSTMVQQTPSSLLYKRNDLEAKLEDLMDEEKYLCSLLAQEEETLKQDLVVLGQEKERLSNTLLEAKEIEHEIESLRGETRQQAEELQRDGLLMEAQRIKLLRELRTIYPITIIDEDPPKYLIRGLELPADLNTSAVTEEEISAALGFICHLVCQMQKYLSVQFRYRIFCNSSRSAIQQGTIIYPLFIARVVEREQVDRGMMLLNANVDCVLKTLQIEFNKKSHILARLQKVYRCFIDGN